MKFKFSLVLALGLMVPWLPQAAFAQAALAPSAATRFSPEIVFGGRSEGTGTLQLGMGKARPFHVRSNGASAGGHLRLHQQVQFEGKAATTREWDLTRAGPDHYVGTLTDAAGPVDAYVHGRRLTLRYALNRGGLAMHQTLDLAPNGRTIDNRATVRFLGVPIGWLRETITVLP